MFQIVKKITRKDVEVVVEMITIVKKRCVEIIISAKRTVNKIILMMRENQT